MIETLFSNGRKLGEYSARWLASRIRQQPGALICLAAGHTQRTTYTALSRMVCAGELDMSRTRIIGLDEWEGLNASDQGSCRYFMDETLFKPAAIPPERIVFFDGRADLEAQCARMDAYLDENGPIDVLCLGVGMNGHVAFNEPGCAPGGRSRIVPLDEVTQTVGQKYFPKQMRLSRGVCLGMRDLLAARAVIIQIEGAHKAQIARAVRSGVITDQVPATLMLEHANLELVLDAAAAEE